MIGRHPVHDRCQHAHRSRPHGKFRPVAQPREVVRPLLRQQPHALHTAVVQRPRQARPCRRFGRHLHHHESVAELLRPHPRPPDPGQCLRFPAVARPRRETTDHALCAGGAGCAHGARASRSPGPAGRPVSRQSLRYGRALPTRYRPAFRARARPSSRSRPPAWQCRAASAGEGHRGCTGHLPSLR